MSEVKFGTGGFRGIIGESFTKDNIQKICQAIANITNNKKLKKQIYIGYDNRFMSEDFARYSAEVFLANNFSVSLTRHSCSTPVVMYRTMIEGNDYGIMITASHNPHIYNGIKVFVKGGKDASLEETKLIEQEYNLVQKVNTTAIVYNKDCNLRLVDNQNEFVDYIIKNQSIPNLDGMKVAFDNKFGSTRHALEVLCKKLNIENYKILNKYRDAFFGFHLPAPTYDNIALLKEEVINNGYDIGFAVDADGDRLGIVDEKGNYVDNNYILALIYYYLVKYEHKTGGIVKNIATSNIVDKIALNLNMPCYEVPVGFKFISSKLLETHSVIGGESSGGLAVSNHILGKDSLLSIALCLKIMKVLKKPFSELINELKVQAGNYNMVIVDTSYTYSLANETRIKDKLFNKKELPTLNKQVDRIVVEDYVKVYYTDGSWALIRFSGTEPIIRIFVEDYSSENCKNEISLWKNFLGL